MRERTIHHGSFFLLHVILRGWRFLFAGALRRRKDIAAAAAASLQQRPLAGFLAQFSGFGLDGLRKLTSMRLEKVSKFSRPPHVRFGAGDFSERPSYANQAAWRANIRCAYALAVSGMSGAAFAVWGGGRGGCRVRDPADDESGWDEFRWGGAKKGRAGGRGVRGIRRALVR